MFVLNFRIFVLSFGIFVLNFGIFVLNTRVFVLNFRIFVLNFRIFVLNFKIFVLNFVPLCRQKDDGGLAAKAAGRNSRVCTLQLTSKVPQKRPRGVTSHQLCIIKETPIEPEISPGAPA